MSVWLMWCEPGRRSDKLGGVVRASRAAAALGVWACCSREKHSRARELEIVLTAGIVALVESTDVVRACSGRKNQGRVQEVKRALGAQNA